MSRSAATRTEFIARSRPSWRALAAGRLPFWSDRFGLGIPLVAESHVAAFYPPNLVFYRLLGVSSAYRLSMWLHFVALAATTYLYARTLGAVPWGGAIGAVAFSLCGFQTVHSSHEPFYCLMPYLPLALAIAERYLADGRTWWVPLLALCLAIQWTVGHFQIQVWTAGLVVFTGLWCAGLDRRLLLRAVALLLATLWGASAAAIQLGLSWELAGLVGQARLSAGERLYYPFPPSHWFRAGAAAAGARPCTRARGPVLAVRGTTGYEAALWVGTVPLVLAAIGCWRPFNRRAALWRIVVPVSFALATMPHWWPAGYIRLLALPGVGYFRVPARYTLLTSLGLAMLAADGCDRSIPKARFRAGFLVAIGFGALAALAAVRFAGRPDVHLRLFLGDTIDGIVWRCRWCVAPVAVPGWYRGRIGSWALVAAAGIELGILFHCGTTQWGWSIALPEQSPILSRLTGESRVGLVAGPLENLPVRVGLRTAFPHLGFALPRPDDVLKLIQERLALGEAVEDPELPNVEALTRWFRRFGVTHVVGHGPLYRELGTELGHWHDPALDVMLHRLPTERATRAWSLVRLAEPFPEARVAAQGRTIAGRPALIERLTRSDDVDVAWFLAEDHVPERPAARMVRLVSWQGNSATVEHDGPCDLVIARTFDPGWMARIDDGLERPVVPADGGFQSVRLAGSGTNRVDLRYHAPRLLLWASISLGAILAIGAAAGAVAVGRRVRLAGESARTKAVPPLRRGGRGGDGAPLRPLAFASRNR